MRSGDLRARVERRAALRQIYQKALSEHFPAAIYRNASSDVLLRGNLRLRVERRAAPRQSAGARRAARSLAAIYGDARTDVLSGGNLRERVQRRAPQRQTTGPVERRTAQRQSTGTSRATRSSATHSTVMRHWSRCPAAMYMRAPSCVLLRSNTRQCVERRALQRQSFFRHLGK